MTILAHLADRALNRPLLITPEKAQVIMSVLGGRIGIDAPQASRFEGEAFERDADGNVKALAPYRVKDGVAIVTVTGSLVNRGAWIGANSGLTSYEGIRHQLKTAAAAGDVRSIILDLHSPGGEAVGAMETAELVRRVAAAKPVTAVVNGMAASAAYAIASGAREIVTIETGVSGSIGVVLLHADFSRNLDREGITPTLIFAGDHKVDGNPFEPLPQDVRDDLQAEVDTVYAAFVRGVAAGRGNRLTEAAARATEARAFSGEAAVRIGLADRVGSFDAVLEDMINRARGRTTSQRRGVPMSEQPTGTPAAENAGFTQADLDKASADAKTAEGARLKAIVAAEGIKGHPARLSAALDLATKTPGMSAEDVTGFVVENVAAAAAEAKPAATAEEAGKAALKNRAAVPDSLAEAGVADKPRQKAVIDTRGIYASRRPQ